MKNLLFYNQADLMIKVLPIIAEHKEFALKGGTALNLFILDMPRLSVDIDLAFIPILERKETLTKISNLLNIIADKITNVYGFTVNISKLRGTNNSIKLVVNSKVAQIKIEPNLIIRGAVFPAKLRHLNRKVRELFNKEVEIAVLNEADLYGGKICAALDRQHPRDLFDIHYLLRYQEITDQIRKAFIVYLVSHNRPISELLKPNLKNITTDYSNSFEGMASEQLGLDSLIKTRTNLVKLINKLLSEDERNFLISVSDGNPDFELIGLPYVSNFPAIKWKLYNINNMDNNKKLLETKKLKSILFG